MAQLSQFYYNGVLKEGIEIIFDDATAKHIWQVLRMQEGDKLLVTDGKGNVTMAVLSESERFKCAAIPGKVNYHPRNNGIMHLCVGFTKNNSRNEWLLEKAAELGVSTITPIVTTRSEKAYFRYERWEKLLISATMQSLRYYIPVLNEITLLKDVLKTYKFTPQKLIAHCNPEEDKKHIRELLSPNTETILLIGPEGDFTSEEVFMCKQNDYKSISLGEHRLRTETAAIVVCAYYNMVNTND